MIISFDQFCVHARSCRHGWYGSRDGWGRGKAKEFGHVAKPKMM
jgi:hypothetical protein